MLRHVIHTIILYVTHIYIIYGEYSHGVCTYAAHLLYGGSPRANGGGAGAFGNSWVKLLLT